MPLFPRKLQKISEVCQFLFVIIIKTSEGFEVCLDQQKELMGFISDRSKLYRSQYTDTRTELWIVVLELQTFKELIPWDLYFSNLNYFPSFLSIVVNSAIILASCFNKFHSYINILDQYYNPHSKYNQQNKQAISERKSNQSKIQTGKFESVNFKFSVWPKCEWKLFE